MNKTTNTLADLKVIANALTNILAQKKMTYKGIAGLSGLSVNTVKAILSGEPANIINYDSVANALETSLIKIIQGLSATPEKQVNITVATESLALGTAVRQKVAKNAVAVKTIDQKESSESSEEKPFSL